MRQQVEETIEVIRPALHADGGAQHAAGLLVPKAPFANLTLPIDTALGGGGRTARRARQGVRRELRDVVQVRRLLRGIVFRTNLAEQVAVLVANLLGALAAALARGDVVGANDVIIGLVEALKARADALERRRAENGTRDGVIAHALVTDALLTLQAGLQNGAPELEHGADSLEDYDANMAHQRMITPEAAVRILVRFERVRLLTMRATQAVLHWESKVAAADQRLGALRAGGDATDKTKLVEAQNELADAQTELAKAQEDQRLLHVMFSRGRQIMEAGGGKDTLGGICGVQPEDVAAIASAHIQQAEMQNYTIRGIAARNAEYQARQRRMAILNAQRPGGFGQFQIL
jgi:hypothetical protein